MRRKPRPREDFGFFGPGSPTWRVWTHPTAVLGFQRAIVVETFDPFLAAAVHDQNGVRRDPLGRLQRTFDYFVTVAVGDSRAAIEASEILMKVHARAVGTEPVSGLPYAANDPDSQLWIHITGWQSNLLMYERYGPGTLSTEDEARYWAECAVAAELQTCDPDQVPRTRDGIRRYFAEVRPRLAATEATQSMMDHLLNAKVMFPPMPLAFRPGAWVVSKLLRWATLATLPRWQRKMAGLRQPRVVDVLIRPLMWMAFHLAALSPRYQLVILNQISPSTVPIVEPLLRGVPPTSDEVLTPGEAFARYGHAPPAEMYERLHGPGAAGEAADTGGDAVLADAT